MNEPNASPSIRVRVAVAQRILSVAPSALVAFGGIYTAYSILQAFKALTTDETATVKTVMDLLGSMAQATSLLYGLAVVIGFIFIIVSVMRSGEEDEASLRGTATFLVCLPAFISPLVSAYAIDKMMAAFHSVSMTDFGKLGGDVAEFCLISIAAGIIAIVLLAAFALIPLRAKPGSRISPIIAGALLTIGTIAVTAYSFWLVIQSQIPSTIPLR